VGKVLFRPCLLWQNVIFPNLYHNYDHYS
jgi:hypothetical protein